MMTLQLLKIDDDDFAAPEDDDFAAPEDDEDDFAAPKDDYGGFAAPEDDYGGFAAPDDDEDETFLLNFSRISFPYSRTTHFLYFDINASPMPTYTKSGSNIVFL